MKKMLDLSKRAVKASVGACAAILLASALGLSYAPSAGIITLLSLQETKKETLRTAFQRFIAFVVATCLAWVSFSLLGYNLLGFAFYLLFFVAFCHWLSISNAIAMCSVLITHFWTEKSMSLSLIGNELLLLVIGAGIGILLNLFLSVSVQRIRDIQHEIDEVIKEILTAMADGLEKKCPKEAEGMKWLGERLKEAKQEINKSADNALTLNFRYYEEYIDMRRNQFLLLKRIEEELLRLDNVPLQAEMVVGFLRKIVLSFGESNNAESLLELAKEIRSEFRMSPLPQSREEFEARAILLHVFDELEYFLLLKSTFAYSLTQEEKKQYWSRQG